MFLNNSELQGICTHFLSSRTIKLENTVIGGLASKKSKLLEITVSGYMIQGKSRVPKLQKKKKT